MNLSIESLDNEEVAVSLPGYLASSSLSLAEIGGLVCFLATFKGQASDERLNSPEFVAAMHSLKEKKVINISVEDKKVKIDVDLAITMMDEEGES